MPRQKKKSIETKLRARRLKYWRKKAEKIARIKLQNEQAKSNDMTDGRRSLPLIAEDKAETVMLCQVKEEYIEEEYIGWDYTEEDLDYGIKQEENDPLETQETSEGLLVDIKTEYLGTVDRTSGFLVTDTSYDRSSEHFSTLRKEQRTEKLFVSDYCDTILDCPSQLSTHTGDKLRETLTDETLCMKDETPFISDETHTDETPFISDETHTDETPFISDETHTDETPCISIECEQTFTRPYDFTNQAGEKPKPYACDECNKSFSHLSVLSRHKLSHSGEKPYECDVCEKSYSRVTDLTRHKMCHTGERPYACNECGKTFVRSSHLSKHKITHSSKKPYVCDECGKAFSHPSYLTNHKITHTGEKPYVCDECNKAFSRSFHLSDHKRTHTGEKPYVCEICYKGFGHSSHLRAHERTHTGEKPYACKECDRAFAHYSGLKAHKKTHNR